jgi:hypothetical protein
MTIAAVFRRCVEATRQGILITRETSKDKEFHFQNWFKRRLAETGLLFDQGSRNSYPDFTMVQSTEGFEIKGLAYPGRDASFDSNSQVPTGWHNGRTIYYVFGRYPKNPDGNSYPVVDLVVCHGDFLNADHDYEHENKSVRGFGSYGDILIRDRKMYVVPTPFHLLEGVAHQQTLILPQEANPGSEFVSVGTVARIEAAQIVVSYAFNLKTNVLVPTNATNPSAGKAHVFRAWRQKGSATVSVAMRDVNIVKSEVVKDAEGGNG